MWQIEEHLVGIKGLMIGVETRVRSHPASGWLVRVAPHTDRYPAATRRSY